MLDRDQDQQKAMAAIGPILPVLHNILEEAAAVYFGPAYSDEARADHSDRTLANCIYSHAEKGMLIAAEGVGGLNALNVRGLHVLNYQDAALMRFKKVKPNGRHSNYQTKQQQDYDDQKVFPELPEPAFRLTVGYELDAAGVGIQRIMIARPMGRTVLWTAQISMIDAEAVWEDITPRRFAGTGSVDFDADRVRQRRGG